jgi:anti-sigma factor (TIGR02949 family)
MTSHQFEESACDWFRGQLDRQTHDALPAETSQKLLYHLEDCSACAAVWDARSRIRTRLKAAVEAQEVPAELRVKIRERLNKRTTRFWRTGSERWAVAMAAILIVCAGIWLSRSRVRMPDLADRPGQDAYFHRVSATIAAALRLGLGDHIHCSVFRKYPQNPPTIAQMEEKLGTAFSGVLPLVQSAVPDGYRVIMAHHCGYAGRKYTHLTLQKERNRISVVIARKNPGESLDSLFPTMSLSGIRVYQSAAQRYEVASFDAGEYFAFIVSDLPGKTNLQIAADLAPTLQRFLRTLG